MADKPQVALLKEVARRRRRLAHLVNQARLAEENLAIEVSECTALGLSLRELGGWLEVSHPTVAKLRNQGREASDRRSSSPAQQRGERGQERGGAGD